MLECMIRSPVSGAAWCVRILGFQIFALRTFTTELRNSVLTCRIMAWNREFLFFQNVQQLNLFILALWLTPFFRIWFQFSIYFCNNFKFQPFLKEWKADWSEKVNKIFLKIQVKSEYRAPKFRFKFSDESGRGSIIFQKEILASDFSKNARKKERKSLKIENVTLILLDSNRSHPAHYVYYGYMFIITQLNHRIRSIHFD